MFPLHTISLDRSKRSSLENKWIFFNKRILEEFPTTQLTTQ